MAAVSNHQNQQTTHRRDPPDHRTLDVPVQVNQREGQAPALQGNVVDMPENANRPNVNQPEMRPRPALYVCCVECMQSVSTMLKWACCCLCCSEVDVDATSTEEASSMPDDDSASSVPEDGENPQAEDEHGNDASNSGVKRKQYGSDSSSSVV